MREILFRGKRLNTGEWIEGDLLRINGHVFIFPDPAPKGIDKYKVDPATVGQYTGLKDKNGIDIWEGDIIGYKEFRFVVEYKSCMAGFVASFVENKSAYWDLNRKWVITHLVRIIGKSKAEKAINKALGR